MEFVAKVIGLHSWNAYVAMPRGEAFQVIGPLSLEEAEQLKGELDTFFLGVAEIGPTGSRGER